MSKNTELPWLLPAPEDFSARCAALATAQEPIDLAIALADYSLTANQSNRLFKAIRKRLDFCDRAGNAGLSKFRLGIVSNGTMDHMTPILATSALRRGILLETIVADFDQATQEALNPNSVINSAGCDAILIALDARAYPFATGSIAAAAEGFSASDGLTYLERLRSGFSENSRTLCIVQTLVTPPYSLLGHTDANFVGALRHEIAKFNLEMLSSTARSSDIVLDVAAIANNVGVNEWFDERQWYLSRLPMANAFAPLYCEHVTRLVGAVRGKSKKCLVLDLDNTLWGGVIGDDGLEGIKIGQGNAQGESHLAIQRYALEMKQRGIVLAVCSKNDEAIARQAFAEHPDMLLTERDFAVFVANWTDKASNIRSIAKSLNIGLDSLVFVDDNPVEREIVRSLAPQVAVPELPEDPALYPRILAAAGYFETINFTGDDANRGDQYAANAERTELLQGASDIGEFLASLEMKITFSSFNEIGRTRITQLVNKTNQFNLTTLRYSEVEIANFEQDDDIYTLQIRLSDKFGDNGMISVVICRQRDNVWEIDTWLMSCRVINRGVEEAVCDEIVKQAQLNNIDSIEGRYIASPKNGLVKDLYANLGFRYREEDDVWVLKVKMYEWKRPVMEIESV